MNDGRYKFTILGYNEYFEDSFNKVSVYRTIGYILVDLNNIMTCLLMKYKLIKKIWSEITKIGTFEFFINS